MATDFFKS